MNNKIKEMALIVKELDQSTDGTFYTEEIATALYEAGYRKQSDVAREFADKLKDIYEDRERNELHTRISFLTNKINEVAKEFGVEE